MQKYLGLTLWCIFAMTAHAQAQQQDSYYVFDGQKVRPVHDNPPDAQYRKWQVWLYEEPVTMPRNTTSLPYSRWGVIEATSAERLMKQLKTLQNFELAYTNFFGRGTWGRYTYFNPAGPIAVTGSAATRDSLGTFELTQLDYRLSRLILDVQPSLEINQRDDEAVPLKEYFDRIRDSLQQLSRVYSQLATGRGQPTFIDNEIKQIRTSVSGVENNVQKITAVLPTVKLPTSNTWMSHSEWAGSDGTIEVVVKEMDSGVSVQQTWTGGDGKMTGAVVTTVVRYEDIGRVDLEPPARSIGNTWRVRVESAHAPFPLTMTSPERNDGTHTFRAVNYTASDHFARLEFQNSAEAQDAYAFFLYHKERVHQPAVSKPLSKEAPEQ